MRVERRERKYDQDHLKEWIYGGLGLWCDETGGLFNGGTYLYRYSNKNWYMPQYIEGNSVGGSSILGDIKYITGNNLSDFMIVNYNSEVFHINGEVASRIYSAPRQTNLSLYGIDASDNTICMAGTRYDPINRGVIIIGRR